jgi:hypothetical protein
MYMVKSFRAFSLDRLLTRLSATSIVLCALSIAAGPATTATTAPLSATALTALRKTAQGTNLPDAFAALKQLAAYGDKETVRQAAPTFLTRDSLAIKEEATTVAANLPRLRATEREIDALRPAALEAVEKMVKDPAVLKSVKQDYDKLAALQAKLAIDYARQLHLIDAIDRRAQCLTLWRTADPSAILARAALTDPETQRLEKAIESAIGFPPAAVVEWNTGPIDPPANVALHGLWFYVTCQRIETYNKSLESNMNLGEVMHTRKVDAYRESLGLLPYEIDLRLTQAARRHSKEMMDLWYFSHWSPTEGLHSSFDRMAAAGYRRGASENITMGSWTADDAFWHFFNSPEHHRAWIKPWECGCGVGKWENAWTECFGGNKRLMLASDADRERAVIVGEILKPQTTEETRKKPRDLRDFTFYDLHGNKVTPDAFKSIPK